MNAELTLYLDELQRQLGKLCDAVEPLNEAQLNWKPPVPEANSCYVIMTHVLGNVEAWVLGIVCEQAMRRDRPGEFASAGPNATQLLANARELLNRARAALAALPDGALDEIREPSQELWGEGTPEPVAVRAALLHAIEHAASHFGQVEVTRDLALAGAEG